MITFSKISSTRGIHVNICKAKRSLRSRYNFALRKKNLGCVTTCLKASRQLFEFVPVLRRFGNISLSFRRRG